MEKEDKKMLLEMCDNLKDVIQTGSAKDSLRITECIRIVIEKIMDNEE